VVKTAAAALAALLVTAGAGCSAAASPGAAPRTAHRLMTPARDRTVTPARDRTATPARDRTVTPPQGTDSGHPEGLLGSFLVGQRWLRFSEPAHRGVTGAGLSRRRLLLQVLYPAAPGRLRQPAKGAFPMLMLAPGFMQCGGPYDPMLRSWASAGYVVVVVNFPNSDCRAGAAATESDMVNQPADVSFAISRMLALDAAANGPFAGVVNPRAIAVAGQSDGGDTVAALVASTCCSDRRVAAAAVLSGAEWPQMPGRYFARTPVPMLFTQGSADQINWPGCSVQLYRADPAGARYYLDLFGASHTGPYWGTDRYERTVVRVGLAFFDRFVLGRPAAARAMRAAGDVPGVAALYGSGAGRLDPGPCDN